MPRYLLHPRGDGEEPGYSLVADDYEASVGEVVVDEDPSGKVWDGPVGELRARTASEDLAYAKAQKEAELRDAANAWYQSSVRGFEGAIVAAKYGRSGLTALNAEERSVFDEMNANYTKLKNLIGQVRDPATDTVAEVEAIAWT
jgi:hypothetical protein